MKKKSILLVILAGMALGCATAYSAEVIAGLRQSVVRLHILANSDSEVDQALKLRVRDKILDNFGDILEQCDSPEQARKVITDNLALIESCSEQEIRDNGFDYNVTAALVEQTFPARQYASLSLPKGDYNALRIEIGKAEGQNWWCVMFPPLCFVNGVNGEAEESAMEVFKENVTADQFELATSGELPVEIRYKIVEVLGDSYNTVKNVFAKK